MTKPVRLIILEAMTTALDGITSANGFETDLKPGSVTRGRVKFGTSDPLPAIAMFEPPVVDTVPVMAPAGGPHRKGQFTVIVQGFVKNGVPHELDPAYIFSAEVCMVLATEAGRMKGRSPDPLGVGLIEKMVIGIPIVRPSDDISATAYFWLTVTFDLVEDLTKPMR